MAQNKEKGYHKKCDFGKVQFAKRVYQRFHKPTAGHVGERFARHFGNTVASLGELQWRSSWILK